MTDNPVNPWLSNVRLAAMLNDALKLEGRARINPRNVRDWLEGGNTYDKCDNAVRAYMGDEMYNEFDQLARLYWVLCAKLQGYDKCTVSGMEFHRLQNNEPW